MNPTLFIHGALIERIRGEIAVDVARSQVRHHLGRRHDANLHVLIGMDAAFGEEIAQQKIMHRVVEGDAELKAFHVLARSFTPLCLLAA